MEDYSMNNTEEIKNIHNQLAKLIENDKKQGGEISDLQGEIRGLKSWIKTASRTLKWEQPKIS